MKSFYSLTIWSCVLICGFGRGVVAREIVIATPSQIAASLATIQPGDIVILKNGSWVNADILVNKGGEPGHPVEIRAERPGGVVLGGISSLEINAPYVTVDGLFFDKGTTGKNSVIQFNSHHGILRNSAIVDYNPARFATKYY